ncbi:M30 family zinc metallopeptidase [Paraburkholderia acidiphila]|uniref:Hemagglutinin n=1 Tax=Paraburkholderia acidiphila TaxID=2571747 RepID=A0A7Z2G9B0_9BURK|nr:hemagglutinin [Paraburkholderia acidiphila]QGZ57556.1 hemagglutinin [Paraburkholderia acidiphila]
MRNQRFKTISAVSTTIALAVALAACGGGGGDTSTTSTNTTTNTPVTSAPGTATPTADGQLHAACTNCGASDDQTYSGSGVGVWQALNSSAQNDTVTIALKNVTGKNVSLVFTNEGTTSQTMQSIPVTQSMISGPSMSQMAQAEQAAASNSESPQMRAIHEFNENGWVSLATRQTSAVTQRNMLSAAASQIVGVGATRSFWLADGTTRATTLEAQSQTSDGTTVNIWVQTSEYTSSKVTPQIVAQLMQKYAGSGGVYDIDTSIGGPFWGAGLYSGVIAPTGQPIDLVVVNLTPDGQPFGLVGYYYSLNNFTNAGTGQTATSNADLSLYLDSETLYLGGTAGIQAMQTTMAHESLHMQNFYRRGMLMGDQYRYATWLEEMTAMMMEDWASFKLDSTYNSVRDNRFPQYQTYNGHGSYLCGLTTWDPMDTGCDSYSTNGSFGGFLNRQLGLDFYKALLNDKSSTDSLAVLNDAIRQFRSGSSVQQELRHFTAAAGSQIPLGANMADYSFPARTDSGFTLPAIDPSLGQQDFPASSPSVLLGMASLPVVRSHVSASYQETVTVPPGTTLTVVVH